jgi:hypothetical protein
MYLSSTAAGRLLRPFFTSKNLRLQPECTFEGDAVPATTSREREARRRTLNVPQTRIATTTRRAPAFRHRSHSICRSSPSTDTGTHALPAQQANTKPPALRPVVVYCQHQHGVPRHHPDDVLPPLPGHLRPLTARQTRQLQKRFMSILRMSGILRIPYD